jgi:hypothetical protein
MLQEIIAIALLISALSYLGIKMKGAFSHKKDAGGCPKCDLNPTNIDNKAKK